MSASRFAESPTPQPAQTPPSSPRNLSFRDDDDEGGDELGEEANENSIAGGGHGIGGAADLEERKKLRVSYALRSFLAQAGEIGKADIGGDDDETVVSTHKACNGSDDDFSKPGT